MMMDAWALQGRQHSSPATYRSAMAWGTSREKYSARGASPTSAFRSATSSLAKTGFGSFQPYRSHKGLAANRD